MWPMAMSPGSRSIEVAAGKGLADVAHVALGVEAPAVERGDAAGLLAAMLQGMQAERRNRGGVGMAENAEHAASFAQPIAVRVHKFLPLEGNRPRLRSSDHTRNRPHAGPCGDPPPFRTGRRDRRDDRQEPSSSPPIRPHNEAVTPLDRAGRAEIVRLAVRHLLLLLDLQVERLEVR